VARDDNGSTLPNNSNSSSSSINGNGNSKNNDDNNSNCCLDLTMPASGVVKREREASIVHGVQRYGSEGVRSSGSMHNQSNLPGANAWAQVATLLLTQQPAKVRECGVCWFIGTDMRVV